MSVRYKGYYEVDSTMLDVEATSDSTRAFIENEILGDLETRDILFKHSGAVVESARVTDVKHIPTGAFHHDIYEVYFEIVVSGDFVEETFIYELYCDHIERV